MSEVRVDRAGVVLRVVLDAPDRRNALSRSMLAALEQALAGIDAEVAGVVLSGRGGSFSAGADFHELTGSPDDLTFDDAVSRVTSAIIATPCPVIAAIEGACLGAAADIALTCDVRIAGSSSFVQVPAVRLGLLYNPAAVERLRRSFPRDAVRRLLVLAERFSAADALRAGLVSTVVPDGDAVARAESLLAGVDPVELPAIAATKRLLDDLEAGTHDLDHWSRTRRDLLGSPTRIAAVERSRRRHVAHQK